METCIGLFVSSGQTQGMTALDILYGAGSGLQRQVSQESQMETASPLIIYL